MQNGHMKESPWMMVITEGLFALTLFLSAFTSYQATSEHDLETMERSNQLYENGRFQEAVLTYQQLVDQGIHDERLYYNLGNAYYKTGDLGRAILNYERARRLAPRDADVQANLAFARSQALDRYETQTSTPLQAWVRLTSAQLTLNELSLLALGSFWLVGIVALIYQHSGEGRNRTTLKAAVILVVVLFGISIITLGGRVALENANPVAIVVEDHVELLSSPGVNSITEFSLHAGAQVKILESRGKWVRLALPGDEFQGWAPRESVERIG